MKNRIQEALDYRGMRASELAEKTGLSTAAISSYVNHRYEPKQMALYLMAKALNVSEMWLAGYDAPRIRTSDLERAKSIEEIATELENNPRVKRLMAYALQFSDKQMQTIESMIEMMGFEDKE